MGLDMYLEMAVHTSNFHHRPEDEDPAKLENRLRAIADELNLPADNAGKGNYGSIVVTVHAGYWRKANAIHNWFVTQLAEGVDECQPIDVELGQLQQLRDLCRQVLTASVTEWGQVRTGTVVSEKVEAPVDAAFADPATGRMVTAVAHHEETGWSIWTSEHVEGEPTYTEGAFIVNAEKAEELLPTTSGFFFGGTGYDSWYLEDLGHTIDVIDKVEEAFGRMKESGGWPSLTYRASW